MRHTPWQPPLNPHEEQIWSGLPLTAQSLAISRFARAWPAWTVVVAASTLQAQQLLDEIAYFIQDDRYPLHLFPDWETLAYDAFSPHEDIISNRLKILSQLQQVERSILIVPINTLLQRLAPTQYVSARTFYLKVGQTVDVTAFTRQLQQAGYHAVSQVYSHGEYASRGSILDLFPMGSTVPYRIDLLDTEIDSIRTFDIESQLSLEKVELIDILPAREFALDEASLQQFRFNWRQQFNGDPMQSPFYKNIQNGVVPSGAEYYLPLFHPHTDTLFDYLPPNPYFFLPKNYEDLSEICNQEWQDRYERRQLDRTRPLLPPAQLLMNTQELKSRFNSLEKHICLLSHSPLNQSVDFGIEPAPSLILHTQKTDTLSEIKSYVQQSKQRLLISAHSLGRLQFNRDFFDKHGVDLPRTDSVDAFLNSAHPLSIVLAPLYDNFNCPALKITIVNEASLWGQKITEPRKTRKEKRYSDDFSNLAELSVGAPVVHLDHGIGRYEGLMVLDAGGQKGEYLLLSYENEDKLYVPVSSLHLISRYSGVGSDSVSLSHLGSPQWQKAKEKALAKARDTAVELLALYAKRQSLSGHHFQIDELEYQQFCQGFPFEETEDQQQAIDAVMADMAADTPMDRLVCGDVGFGKTEVAMRAAFIAVMNKKQVAILVPTTLLAEQHYASFLERFANWPVKIAALSRFQSTKSQHSILEELAEGKIDIVIGTHKLIQPQVKFKYLGLVIIDEEHRFGVQQKEKLKTLRAEIDILTLTATPIPRTLNMAISDLRQLSIIGTPPPRRLAIKTFLHEYDTGLIREAILREIHRGGQVYFLHNDIAHIDRVARELQSLVPEAQFHVAHGQMHERELERIMGEFYHQRFNVLVCTTIIETGIDIPTANTIIINHADRFGLAQLHQLRGRVGRSHHQAYAYLFVNNISLLNKDAQKRLEAITAYDALGVGFILATHDLEIRGAGELLGEDQSGQIQSIGLTLYSELLEKTVKSLKNEETLTVWPETTEIKINLPILIPDDYLPDIHERLVLYKRIASAKNEDELDTLKMEMIDRFGLLPEPTKHLFAVTVLKLKAKALGIRRIDANEQSGKIEFAPKPTIDLVKLIELIQKEPQFFKLENAQVLRFQVKLENAAQRLPWLNDLLEKLSGSPLNTEN